MMSNKPIKIMLVEDNPEDARRLQEILAKADTARFELAQAEQLSEALAHERDLLQALMNNIPDTIYFKDATSRFTRINRAQAQVLGVNDPEEAIGKTDFDFFTAEHAQDAYEDEQKIVKLGQPLIDKVEKIKRADGQIRWVSATKVPTVDKEGRVIGIVGISRDITERKEVEGLKDELVSIVSHELRTPLTSLRGFAELMLQREFSEEKQRGFISIIHNEAIRLTDLINDFLDIQRIESGRQIYNFANADIVPLLHERVALFGQEEGNHTLRLEAPGTLPLVRADVDRVRQVISNLLSNAVKFSPHGGEVILGARQEGANAVVWVADQGVGIPPEALPKLFSKFFRVDNRETRSIGGTGLGLALVKKIVEAHKGQVWVESQFAKGSTFFFTLPTANRALAMRRSPASTDQLLR